MGIKINDLDDNLNYSGESKLSSNKNNLDNLRELSSKELEICGGMGPIFANTGGPPPFRSTFVSGGSGGFGGGTGPIFVDTGGPPPFRSTFVSGGSGGFGVPISGGFGVPISGGFGVPISGGFGVPTGGSGFDININNNVNTDTSSSASNFRP